jgi:CheY-like chemotaxis protein
MYKPIELLIVDENPGDIRLFQEFFKSSRLSNNVNYVRNPQQMVSFLQRDGQYQNAPEPDLILVDVRPFLLNGLQGLDNIKSHPFFKNAVLVGLLGAAGEEQGLPDGAAFVDYLVKPLDLGQLSQALTKVKNLGLVISRLGAPAQMVAGV